MTYCEAGRSAFFGGKWKEPCDGVGNNIIGTNKKGSVIKLCDIHIQEVLEAGLITQPFISKEGWEHETGTKLPVE